MRSTIIIKKQGEHYIATIVGRFGGGYQGRHLEGDLHDIAAQVAEASLNYCLSNPEGGDVMAPPEILDLIPEHLRSVPSEAVERGKKGGSAKSAAKKDAARENGKKGGRPRVEKD